MGKRNKIMIVGATGLGKSYLALETGLRKKDTTVIIDYCGDKGCYEKYFPELKDYMSYDIDNCPSSIKKNGKYYIGAASPDLASGRNPFPSFSGILYMVNFLAYENKHYMKDDRAATIILDSIESSFPLQDHNNHNYVDDLISLASAEANIIIVGQSLSSILDLKESDITDEIMNRILDNWIIVDITAREKMTIRNMTDLKTGLFTGTDIGRYSKKFNSKAFQLSRRLNSDEYLVGRLMVKEDPRMSEIMKIATTLEDLSILPFTCILFSFDFYCYLHMYDSGPSSVIDNALYVLLEKGLLGMAIISILIEFIYLFYAIIRMLFRMVRDTLHKNIKGRGVGDAKGVK